MNLSSFLGAVTLLTSGYPTVYHEYATSHPKNGASLLFDSSVVVPDTNPKYSGSKIADSYYLTIYKEKSNGLTPLKLLTSPTYVTKQTTITFSESDQITTTFSGSKTLSVGLTSKVTAELDRKGIVKLGGEISTSYDQDLTYGYQYSNTNISLLSESIYIDGVNNKYGVYAYAFCSTSSISYYATYSHSRYTNYDQDGKYQTRLLYENCDGRFSLGDRKSTYINHLYYFESLSAYEQFCSDWGLTR